MNAYSVQSGFHKVITMVMYRCYVHITYFYIIPAWQLYFLLVCKLLMVLELKGNLSIWT